MFIIHKYAHISSSRHTTIFYFLKIFCVPMSVLSIVCHDLVSHDHVSCFLE